MQRAGIAILLYAGASRILRAGLRWEEWALHYSAYNLEAQEVLQSGGIVEAMQVWAGLHPPGYPVLHSLLSTMWPAPAAWLLFSTLCSVGAVYFLLKAHPKHHALHDLGRALKPSSVDVIVIPISVEGRVIQTILSDLA